MMFSEYNEEQFYFNQVQREREIKLIFILLIKLSFLIDPIL